MKLLFCGDVVGRTGREAILEHIPLLRNRLGLDYVIVNAENAAHGFGVTPAICKDMYAAGVDVITTGNHIWDQKDIVGHIDQDKNLLRPLNYPPKTPGNGFVVVQKDNAPALLVVNLMGRLFMDALDDPFAAMDALLRTYTLGKNVAAIFVDFHAEATSEKMAAGHYFDGRISGLVGTHTHVPTADCHILPKGTAYQTDAGMTGDYDSVVGMKKDVPIDRFVKKFSKERLSAADGPATLCGTFIETDDKTGKALKIIPIRVGGILPQIETL
ncbi:MAG: TIGR00282 family metallophosphoesterase [Alphaproteobacteria bacterium]